MQIFFHRRRRNFGKYCSRLWIFKILCTQFPLKNQANAAVLWIT